MLDGEQEAKLIAMRLGSPPDVYGRWSLRLLTDQRKENIKMFRSITSIALAFLLLATYLSAQESSGSSNMVKTIERDLSNCYIDRDYTTAGMTECEFKAYEEYDKVLNAVYQKLMVILNEPAKEKLIKSQRRWIKFRDAEFEMIKQIYSTLQGTMWIPMHVAERVAIVRHRVEELSGLQIIALEAIS